MNRRFFLTESGLIGLGLVETEEGDFICVLYGGNRPYILRRIDQRKKFQFIGEAYVHGIMYGEAVPEGVEDEEVTLI